VAGITHDGPFTLDMAQKAVVNFNQIGKRLKDEYGPMFCYHNYGYEFEPYEKGALFDYIVRHINPEYVNFEMDILWTVFLGQNPFTLA
jgi:hypothetical protein